MTNGISNLTLYTFVAIGGATGASLRFYVYQLMLNWLGKGFPFATLAVNIIGSFIIGILYSVIEEGLIDVTIHRTLIGIGLLGAFTTFSTFSLDTFLLFQQGELVKAVLNIVLNVGLCLLVAGLGVYLVSYFANK